MRNDGTVEFKEDKVKAYLDQAIRFWRGMVRRGHTGSEYYVDAYQSVRVSIFGEKLKEEHDEGEAAKSKPENSL